MNAAFINYKKRRLFFEVVNTVEAIVKQMAEEKEAEENAKQLAQEVLDPKVEYQVKLQEMRHHH